MFVLGEFTPSNPIIGDQKKVSENQATVMAHIWSIEASITKALDVWNEAILGWGRICCNWREQQNPHQKS